MMSPWVGTVGRDYWRAEMIDAIVGRLGSPVVPPPHRAGRSLARLVEAGIIEEIN
jgi:hypothetical protein